MYKIYMYTNNINGMIYIGQTRNSLEKRAQAGGQNYKECPYFWNAIQKYGWDNFTPTILKDNLTCEEANVYEEYFISLYNSTNRDIGYNICLGGNNHTMSDEQKRIISEKAKLRYTNPTCNPMYGKKHSEESINKMKSKKMGENNPMYGTHMSEELKEHLSKMFTGTNITNRKTPYSEEELETRRKKMKDNSKLWERKIRCIDDDIIFDTLTDAAKFYNRSIASICDVCKGRSHTCAGKRFEYVD